MPTNDDARFAAKTAGSDAGRRAQAIRAAQAKLAIRNTAARAEVATRFAEPEFARRLACIYREVMTRAAAMRAAQATVITATPVEAQEQAHEVLPVDVPEHV